MLKPVRIFYLFVCLLLLLAPAHLAAQTQGSTGEIAGTVADSAGAVVPNAGVTVSTAQTGLTRTVTSNAEGLYRITLLPVGHYNVKVTASGFAAEVANDVPVEVGRTATINFKLQVGRVEQTVEVTAEAIRVEQSNPDSYVNAQAIGDLPIFGRRFHDFVTLTPTAQIEPNRNQISLSGQRGINGNVMIDGADYNNPFFGGMRMGERAANAFSIPQEAIGEFQVTTSSYSAEFGRSTGGLVVAATKAGTNVVHGSLFYLTRNRSFAASNEFFDEVQLRTGRRFSAAPTQHQFGASLGGPVKRDKLFLFGAWEQQIVRSNRRVIFDNLVGYTPSGATAAQQTEAFNFYRSLEVPFLQTNDAGTEFIRADWQISQRQRLNLRFHHADNGADNANAAGNQIFPTTNSAVSNNGREEDHQNTGVAQLTSFFGTSLANDLRYQMSYEERPRLTNSTSPLVSNSIGSFGQVRFLPTTESDWRLQIADSVSWIRGTHAIKFGGDFNRLHAEQFFAFAQFGTFDISGSTTTSSGLASMLSLMGCVLPNPAGTTCVQGATRVNRLDATTVNYARAVGNGLESFSGSLGALFVQDSWKLRPNLTVNYGLRWEGAWNPQPEISNPGLVAKVRRFVFPNGRSVDPTKIPNQRAQFAPRLGFAWDPLHDGKTVIRGAGGIYYAQTPFLSYATPLNNFRLPPGDQRAFLPFNVANVSGSPTLPCSLTNLKSCNTVYKQLTLAGIDLNTFPIGSLPVLTIDQVQAVAKAFGFDPTTSGVNVVAVDGDNHNPRSYQAVFGVEREVTHGFTVGADASWIKTVFLNRNRDFNLPKPILRSSSAAVTTNNCTTGDPAQRPFYGLRSNCQARPINTLGLVELRESTAKGLYRALTLKANLRRKWGQVNTYYTLSENLTDDDSEREAFNIFLDDSFNLAPEYNFSNIDAKHQFTMYPVIYLPLGFEFSSTVRLRSGRPIDALNPSDVNEDLQSRDRPYAAPGVPFKRNSFRNLALRSWDIRIQKRFRIYERMSAALSAEVFNLPNAMNLQFSGSTAQNYCSFPSGTPLATVGTCGLRGVTNVNFLSLRQKIPTQSNFGRLLLNNTPGDPITATRQLQLGLRLTW